MKRLQSGFALLVLLISFSVYAAEGGNPDLPWGKGYVNLGAYLADLNSAFRLGSSNIGVGISLDAEEFLGLSSANTAFRIDAGYRLGESRRHRADVGWFRFDRNSEKTLTEDVVLPEDLGGDTLHVGTAVNSVFKFDIIKAKYKYALVLDERVDVNVGLGFYVMPVQVGLGKKGEELNQRYITAPLPVMGLGADVVLTRQWILRQNLDVFYLKIGKFKGSVLNAQASLEYSNWKHWGVGAGIDGLVLRIEADGEDYPTIDFVGQIEFSYFGAQLYLKFKY